jgi:hypothetical protein
MSENKTAIRLFLVIAGALTIMACSALLNTREVVFDGDAGAGLVDVRPNLNDASAGDAANDGPLACSASLDADPKNCGRCGHDCLGGTCAAGKCGRVDISVTTGITSLALSDGVVYLASYANSTVSKVSKSGGAEVALGRCGGCRSVAVASDGKTVFAGGDSFDRQPIAFPLDGGVPVGIGSYAYITGLATTANGIALVHQDGVYFTSENGSTNNLLANDKQGRIATDERYAYYTSQSNTFNRVPILSGQIDRVGDSLGDLAGGGAFVRSGRVFWTSPSRTVVGFVASKKTDLTDLVVYAPGKSGLTPVAIASDDMHVYWVTQGLAFGPGLSELHQCPLSGCAESKVIASGFSVGTSLVLDDVSIFVGHGDGVFRVAKP